MVIREIHTYLPFVDDLPQDPGNGSDAPQAAAVLTTDAADANADEDEDEGEDADNAADADLLEALSNGSGPSSIPNLGQDHPVDAQLPAPLVPIEPPAPTPTPTPPAYPTVPNADSSDHHTAPQFFVTRFSHGSPGAPISAARGSTIYQSSQEAFEASDWAPFRSQCDWEIAHWAKTRGPTSSAMEELLAIPEVCTHFWLFWCRVRSSPCSNRAMARV